MSEKRFVYQLVADGSSACFSGKHHISNNVVFSTREAAEKRIAKFRAAVTNPNLIHGLEDNDELKIIVKALEVVEDE